MGFAIKKMRYELDPCEVLTVIGHLALNAISEDALESGRQQGRFEFFLVKT